MYNDNIIIKLTPDYVTYHYVILIYYILSMYNI